MTKLPAGWRVENLGLIGAVEFSRTVGTTHNALIWCDGQWLITVGSVSHRAPGVPRALTMSEARKVGTAYIERCFADIS